MTIEHLDHRDVIARDDQPRTPFHLDPPCRGRDDLARRAGQLAVPGSRVIPSLNDRPAVRRLSARFPIDAVETTRAAGGAPTIRQACDLPITRPRTRGRWRDWSVNPAQGRFKCAPDADI